MDLHYNFEKNQNYIQIKNNNDDLVAFVDLINGGSLLHLQLNGITLIEEKKEFSYSDSFASAILFPFVNRLKNGVYFFKNKSHQTLFKRCFPENSKLEIAACSVSGDSKTYLADLIGESLFKNGGTTKSYTKVALGSMSLKHYSAFSKPYLTRSPNLDRVIWWPFHTMVLGPLGGLYNKSIERISTIEPN